MDLFLPRHSAYSTTVMANYRPRLEKAVGVIEKAVILKGTNAIQINSNQGMIEIIGEADALSIQYPMHLKYRDDSTDYLPAFTAALDLRNYVNKEGKIRNTVEAERLARQAVIESLWHQDPQMFGRLYKTLVDLFATWMSSGLSRRYGYTLEQSHYMKAIMALYYFGLVYALDEDAYHDDELRARAATVVSQATAMPATYLLEVMDAIRGADEGGNGRLVALLTDGYKRDNKVSALQNLLDVLNALDMFHETHTLQSLYSATCGGAVIAPNAVELGCILIESPPNMIHAIYNCERLKGVMGRTGIGMALNAISRRHPEIEGLSKNMIPYFEHGLNKGAR